MERKKPSVDLAAGPRTVVQYVAGCSRVAPGDALTLCNGTCPVGLTQQRPLSVVVQAGEEPPTDLQAWTQGAVGCYPPGIAQVTLAGVDPLAVLELFRAVVAPATAHVPMLAGDVAVVQMPFIVYATVGQRQWTDVDLGGVSVDLRATPEAFTWTFGDGSDPLVTTDPGAWYPDHTVFHTYTRKGDFTVALSTTFTGEYAINGGPWLLVPGTATAASPPVAAHLVEARAVLVNPDEPALP